MDYTYSRQLRWPLLLPGSSGLISRDFFEAWTLLRVTPSNLYCLLFGREGPSESDQFQGLPEAVLSSLVSILRSFFAV